MNKKLLFGIMSLAALAACTNDDFEGKNGAQVSEQVSPIQFEVINSNDVTRASMNGNKIVWSADDGDLFTLYHGAVLGAITGFENATYKAVQDGEGVAKLTTPSMIKTGGAVMVWPVDSTFRIKPANDLAITIDADQAADIENHIPYMSDLINIGVYNANAPYNTEGYNRTYPVYMRPMASQLILKADYAGTDAALKAMEAGADGIDPIALTSVALQTKTGGTTLFNKSVKVAFTAPAATSKWSTVSNQAWNMVTNYADLTVAANLVTTDYLSTKCINGIESAKFLVLPQDVTVAGFSTTGIAEGAVVVNTTYGKVVIQDPTVGGTETKYTAAEEADAWYRYQAAGTAAVFGETATSIAGTGTDANKVRYTNKIALGLAQVIDAFSKYKMKNASEPVFDEPTGAAGTRYVKVLLTHIDMDGLHIKNDKHLYDAVRVWKEIGTGNVTVNLDGDKDNNFEISQKTIAKINEINAELAEETTPRKFNVTACNVAGEICNTIVITGGGAVKNMDFILNTTGAADVVLKAGETWEWAASTTAAKTLTLSPVATNGVKSIINKGTFVSGATATLAVYDNAATPVQMNVKFVNDGTWNVNAGDVTVQFDVTNNGIVNIKKGAEYHQDITGGATATTFVNDAQTIEERFFKNDPSKTPAQKAAFVEKIGVVNNSGVFAVTGTTAVKGIINNYSLIEHADKDAKTYITANQLGGNYANAWSATNKLGRINLPFSNKDEDNISISAGLLTGFVSVTVSTGDGAPTDGKLNAATVGEKVNYVIINSGVETITEMSALIKYIEFNDDNDTEIAWQAGTSAAPKTATYEGLIVLSPVNIKLYTNVVVNQSTYLAAKVYVGGGFTPANYSGYYGNTAGNVTSMVITY